MKSTLRNAAGAMQAFATDNDGSYEGTTLSDLAEEGLRYPPEITFSLDPNPDKTDLLHRGYPLTNLIDE